jgi:hypothetical protein
LKGPKRNNRQNKNEFQLSIKLRVRWQVADKLLFQDYEKSKKTKKGIKGYVVYSKK